MSRAVVPTANSAVSIPNKKIYLAVQRGPENVSLLVSRIPFDANVPSVEMTLGAYRTFCLYMLHIFRVVKGDGSFGLRFGKPVRIDDPLKKVLCFLYADIAKLVAPTISDAHEQLEDTAVALYRSRLNNVCSSSFGNAGQHFFYASQIHRINFLLTPIVTAAFNADFDAVKKQLQSISPFALKKVLSEKGTIEIEHLQKRYPGIMRTGTPLQMAIYDHDEEMVEYFKEIMDPAEFERQSKEAFATAFPAEQCAELERNKASALEYYQLMLWTQKKDAITLFADLRKIFLRDKESNFVYDTNTWVARTTLVALQNQVDDFIKQKILNYVKNHPVYNPYLLQTAYDIYVKLLFCENEHARDWYFSHKIIGGIQSFLPPRWLHHFAQDMEDLGTQKVRPDRSFVCDDGHDIRLLVSSRVGEDLFLGKDGPRVRTRCGEAIGSPKNLCRIKIKSFLECYTASASMQPQL